MENLLCRISFSDGEILLDFGNSAQFWLGLQMDYDLDIANQELSEQITEEVQIRRAK